MVLYTQPDHGWAWVVMLASFGAHVIHGFFLYAIGVVNVAFLDRFDHDVGKASWACGVFLGLYGLCGPLSGMIAERWNCRMSMLVGSLVMTSGMVLTAFVNRIDLVIITFGGIGGLGAGICYTSSLVVVGFNFERHRNLASGLATSGTGVGAFVLAPLMQHAKDTFGYSGLCLMCAGLSLQFFVLGALLRPSKLEIQRKVLLKQQVEEKIEKNNNIKKLSNVFIQAGKVLSNVGFTCLFVSLSLCSLGTYLMYVHFSSLAIHLGTSEIDASYLLSIAGSCNAVSRILVGMCSNSDNINELLLYSGCFSVLGVASALLPLYSYSYAGQVSFVVMLGTYAGCCYAVLNSITIKLVGIEHLASAYGLEMFGAGIGSFIGPPVAGWMIEFGMTYSQSFMVAGFIVIIGAASGWSVSCFDNGSASQNDGYKSTEIVIKEEQKLDIIVEKQNTTETKDSKDLTEKLLNGKEANAK
ncbi:hypothetical protein FSP39_024648 [Pinctada imbricata]|uniref:Major facilitator superfamily (MFS) profile domain-containing protein n=1 Tax=Pinctada imbricata TaxID=66713 RepID=A0AA89C8H4_PINIB|nr:hypothetical protein FSP39_024648 [Pinctada imbricata]